MTMSPLLLLLILVTNVRCHKVLPSCDIEAEFCDFDFKIEENYTMMAWGGFLDDVPEIMYPVVVTENGTLKRKRKDCSGVDPISESDQMNIITGDGRYKKIYAVNDQLPGTPIIVYEGQEVAVKVRNRLESGVTTMHWHGLRQRGSPWMDGVFGVSQCPIQPGQSFTYRFIADKAGTYWYHSHLGTQRSMGLAGPLIVLPKSRNIESLRRGKDPLPEFDGDYYMMIQDWFEQPSGEMYHRLQYELISYRGVDDDECFLATKTADGIDLGIVPFESALINGRGRRYNHGNKTQETMVPLETFIVKRGGKYRFRLISAAMAYPFRVSIDRHLLHIIATDGNDVTTTPVESVMIQSGERYDFWIEARDPTLEGNYWIRVETLEYYHHTLVKNTKTFPVPNRSDHRLHNNTAQENQRIKPGQTLGILRYDDAPLEEPKTHRRLCSGVDPCLNLNCPFEHYMKYENNKCVSITKLRDTNMEPTTSPDKPEKFTEYFLNFHFSGRLSSKIGAFKPNINGRIHLPHDRPPQVYPSTYEGMDCNEAECLEDACYCSHQLDLPLGNVIQMVLFTNLPPLEFIGITGTAHPVHMHGHSFQVVKIGYPIYNETTGFFDKNNPDILCNGIMCNEARWADPSWDGGNVPGIISHGAPLKDSVIIPAGGYVVIRFLADNPGFWYMHCHVEYHNEMGMGLVLKEGDTKDMNAAPFSMQECGDFTWSAEEFHQKVNSPSPPGKSISAVDIAPCGDYLTRLKFTTFILAGTTILFAIASFSIYCKNAAAANTISVPPPDWRRITRNTKREEITQLSDSNDESRSRSKRTRRKGRTPSKRSASRGFSTDDEQREPLISNST